MRHPKDMSLSSTLSQAYARPRRLQPQRVYRTHRWVLSIFKINRLGPSKDIGLTQKIDYLARSRILDLVTQE